MCNENNCLLSVSTQALLFALWAVVAARWDPLLFLCLLFDHTRLVLFRECESHPLEVVFTDEATLVKDLVVIWAQFNRIAFLYRTYKVLSLVLLESITHRFLEIGNEHSSDFLRHSLASIDNIPDFNLGASSQMAGRPASRSTPDAFRSAGIIRVSC